MHIFQKLKVLLVLGISLLALNASANVAFAQGDTICNGKVTGVTKVDNPNAGRTSFDSPDNGKTVSLEILGLGDGLAPAKGEYAACISEESGTYDHDGNAATPKVPYDYALKGWAWNDNGGFVSFNCSGGKNISGAGYDSKGNLLDYSCGATVDYGVYIDSAKGEVFGHAWSSTFGWMQFQGKGKSGFSYGVKRDAVTGITAGHAWSQAGIYMDFSGLKLELPEESIKDPVITEEWCEGKPWLCIQVDPDPTDLEIMDPNDPNNPENPNYQGSGGTVIVSTNKQPKLADGQDGYSLHLFLRGADGKTPLDNAQYNVEEFLNGIKFDWDDTVKIDQTLKKVLGNTLDGEPTPWAKKQGAITFKPLVYNGNFVQAKKPDGVTIDPGHYVTNKKISSYAPTTDSKKSYTTSTKPNYSVKNDEFLFDIGKGEPERNELILKQITFGKPLKELATGKVLFNKPVYANGAINLALEFRPAIIVNKLYANDLEDVILAYRSIPINFKISFKILSDSLNKIFDGDKDLKDSIKVIFTLGYSKEETESEPSCDGANPDIVKDFKFNFIDSLGEDLGPSLVKKYADIQGLLGKDWNAQAVAKIEQCLEVDDKGKCKENPGKLPCAMAKGANLYTQIEYIPVKNGKTVKYFDNRLPRVAGDMTLNPVIVVHGNIFAQAAANLSSDTRVQTSGNVNINIIRDTINENLKKYAKNISGLKSGTCKITGLGASPSTSGCTATYSSFVVQNATGTTDDEKVLYFKGADVTIDLGSGGDWSKNWVVISDGGNIFVDSDIYNPSASNYLSLIAFRTDGDNYFKTGNIYVAPCSKNVNNIQANIVADGSLFSYSGDKTYTQNEGVLGLDSKTGEPKWESYVNMVDSLNCQLLIEGTLHSDNTIGGADLDQGEKPRDYLLGGGGKTIKLPVDLDERMRAQYFDLNYLRLFRLALQTSDEGFPIDQKCGKAWKIEDQKKWVEMLVKFDETGEEKGAICGDKSGCDPKKSMFQSNACNGINPLIKYDPTDPDSGDLITPKNADALAQGLKSDDFEPVYIYYKAPMKGSFVFSKKGAINVGGN